MAETHASKALKKIEIHEAECALRYDAINKRLDSGSQRFDKLEKMIWGMYPFILATIAIAEWLK
jgi:hypothetical protein